ncbi:MAG: hypothetical protein OXH04_23995 [Acidobacteria bacterium]|nr:hypothetical protein [Acidobacteriota bacterium]
MTAPGAPRIGFDEEREQFRVLFRTFLRRLFHSDLVPETVDLRQSALGLSAVLTVPPVLYAVALSLNYGSWMSDMQLAVRAVPHKLYFIGYSMATVGLVTVLVGDALFPDRRDAMVLGGLPIRARTVAFSRLAALVAFVGGFAMVVNLPATLVFSFVAGGYLPIDAFLRYPAAHLAATVSAGLLVFLALVAAQAGLALVCPRRVQQRLTMLAQLLFVIVLIEWFAFAPGLLVSLAGIDSAVTNEALIAAGGPYRFIGLTASGAGTWLPPVWFLGLYEVVWGFDPDVYRHLAATAVLAFAAALSVAAVAYGIGLRRMMGQALEAPLDGSGRAGALSRPVARLATAALARHPVARAVAAFAAASTVRSRRHRLIVAAYVGVGLAFVIGSFLSPITGIARGALAEPLTAPSVRLLSIPFILSFFVLAALRVMFTVPTELRANWIFRLTEIDDRGAYLTGARTALWMLGVAPVALVTTPIYLALWGPGFTLAHTAFWVLMAGALTELLLCRFHRVPFACSYVPGKANVKLLWPLYALALTAYSSWAARLELWLLGRPLWWSVACLTMLACLIAAIAWRWRTLAASHLTYEQAADPAVQVLGVMRT